MATTVSTNTGANYHIADRLYTCPNLTILAHEAGHTKHSMATSVATGANKRLALMSGARLCWTYVQ
jgi:hypothetical protein